MIKTFSLHLTADELNTFNDAYQILIELRHEMSSNHRLIHSQSGECIDVDEFARLLGIISGLASEGNWEIE